MMLIGLVASSFATDGFGFNDKGSINSKTFVVKQGSGYCGDTFLLNELGINKSKLKPVALDSSDYAVAYLNINDESDWAVIETDKFVFVYFTNSWTLNGVLIYEYRLYRK